MDMKSWELGLHWELACASFRHPLFRVRQDWKESCHSRRRTNWQRSALLWKWQLSMGIILYEKCMWRNLACVPSCQKKVWIGCHSITFSHKMLWFEGLPLWHLLKYYWRSNRLIHSYVLGTRTQIGYHLLLQTNFCASYSSCHNLSCIN